MTYMVPRLIRLPLGSPTDTYSSYGLPTTLSLMASSPATLLPASMLDVSLNSGQQQHQHTSLIYSHGLYFVTTLGKMHHCPSFSTMSFLL